MPQLQLVLHFLLEGLGLMVLPISTGVACGLTLSFIEVVSFFIKTTYIFMRDLNFIQNPHKKLNLFEKYESLQNHFTEILIWKSFLFRKGIEGKNTFYSVFNNNNELTLEFFPKWTCRIVPEVSCVLQLFSSDWIK